MPGVNNGGRGVDVTVRGQHKEDLHAEGIALDLVYENDIELHTHAGVVSCFDTLL